MSCEILDFLVYDSTTLRSVRLVEDHLGGQDTSLSGRNAGSNPVQTTNAPVDEISHYFV